MEGEASGFYGGEGGAGDEDGVDAVDGMRDGLPAEEGLERVEESLRVGFGVERIARGLGCEIGEKRVVVAGDEGNVLRDTERALREKGDRTEIVDGVGDEKGGGRGGLVEEAGEEAVDAGDGAIVPHDDRLNVAVGGAAEGVGETGFALDIPGALRLAGKKGEAAVAVAEHRPGGVAAAGEIVFVDVGKLMAGVAGAGDDARDALVAEPLLDRAVGVGEDPGGLRVLLHKTAEGVLGKRIEETMTRESGEPEAVFEEEGAEFIDPKGGVGPEILEGLGGEEADGKIRLGRRGGDTGAGDLVAEAVGGDEGAVALELGEGFAEGFATDLERVGEGAFAGEPPLPRARFDPGGNACGDLGSEGLIVGRVGGHHAKGSGG